MGDVYTISGEPVAWTTHRGFGKKSFNPNYHQKRAAQYELTIQHDGRPLHKRAVRVDLFFEMPIPLSMPKKLRKRIESGEKIWHEKRKDRSNLEKHAVDCLTSTVLLDDNIVCSGETQKYYASSEPRTLIVVQKLYD